jgi:hypothetical protein
MIIYYLDWYKEIPKRTEKSRRVKAKIREIEIFNSVIIKISVFYFYLFLTYYNNIKKEIIIDTF